MKNFVTAALMLLSAIPASASGEIVDTLSQSVVTGTRLAIRRDLLPVPVSVVGRSDIAVSDENVLMPVLMEQVPGLFITSRGVTGYGVSGGAAGGISLRGFSAGSGRVLVLVDGHPQYEAIYGHPVADEYTAEPIERVEVSRGASSVLYGSNAMGGAINIITRKPVKEGNVLGFKALGGSYGTMRASFSDSYSKGRFNIIGTVSHDRTDGHRENSAFRSTSGMLKAGYRISDNWRASANGNLVNAFSQNPGTVDVPMLEGTADVTRLMSAVSFENDYGNTSGAINFYYNWGRHVINDGHKIGAAPQPYLFNGTDWQAGLNAYQSLQLFRGNSFTSGLDVKYYGGNAYRNPSTEIYADHLCLNEAAVYVLDRQTLGKFLIDAGLRLEGHSLYGLELVPHLGVSFAPERNTSLKLSASKGFRTPNLRELYMYAVANEDLLPEEAWSFDFSAAHHFLDGKLNAELNLFHTRGSNIIEVNMVDGIRRNRNVGSFANSGLEFAADWKATGNLKFNMNYSFLHMDTVYVGAPVHKAYLGCSWTAGNFSANLGAMGIADLYLATGTGEVKSAYVDVKARVAYKLFRCASVFVRGDNLLNSKYETMLGFPEAGITVLGGISIELK